MDATLCQYPRTRYPYIPGKMSPEDLVMHSSHDLTMDTTEDS
jgi:hypothetical protein